MATHVEERVGPSTQKDTRPSIRGRLERQWVDWMDDQAAVKTSVKLNLALCETSH